MPSVHVLILLPVVIDFGNVRFFFRIRGDLFDSIGNRHEITGIMLQLSPLVRQHLLVQQLFYLGLQIGFRFEVFLGKDLHAHEHLLGSFAHFGKPFSDLLSRDANLFDSRLTPLVKLRSGSRYFFLFDHANSHDQIAQPTLELLVSSRD